MDNSAYFEQAARNIEILLHDQKYKEAYQRCIDLLNQFPEEKILLKLKDKIEREVEERNEGIVDQTIEELKPLWKEEEYAEIINKLKPLLKLRVETEKINELIAKAQDRYKEKMSEMQKNFEKKQKEKLDILLADDESGLLSELFLLEQGNVGNQEVLQITSEYRDKLIQKKIKEKQDLIESGKYDVISSLIEQLKKIDKTNTRIAGLERKIKEHQHNIQLSKKKEFIYESEKHLDTLMRLAKYDKALKVSEEILSIDEDDKKALSSKHKATKKLLVQTRKETVQKIKAESENNKKQYLEDKENFIRI